MPRGVQIPSVCESGPVTVTRLEFERRGTYRDRGVRYLVEVDGVALSPRPSGHGTHEVIGIDVQPGEHLIRVSCRSNRYFQANVDVPDGTTVRLRMVPGPFLESILTTDCQPRLIDMSGRRLPGSTGRREHVVGEPAPRHLR